VCCGKRVALVVSLSLAACARAAPPPDATVAYLDRLIAGDSAAVLAGFADEPSIDDPMAGPVQSGADLGRFVAERHGWLAERGARLEPLRTTRDAQRTVVEAVLHLQLPDTAIDLPIAVVRDRADGPLVRSIRVYHSHWPLEGAHRVRPPLLPPDSTLELIRRSGRPNGRRADPRSSCRTEKHWGASRDRRRAPFLVPFPHRLSANSPLP
jgi:hypothetical protein